MGLAGLVSALFAAWRSSSYQWHLVNYSTMPFPRSAFLGPELFVFLLFGVSLVWSFRTRQTNRGSRGSQHSPQLPSRNFFQSNALCQSVSPFWPMLLALPMGLFLLMDQPPPFWTTLLFVMGGALTGLVVGGRSGKHKVRPWAHPAAVASILVLLVLLTIFHTFAQINYFEHFMLGHADIGHFTEELKNVLAGRGLRSDSFANTRLGWHFVPLLYGLVPGYALFPTPVYLMVVGAILVHLPAIVVYFSARRLSGSVLIGWLLALAWMLLPSTSRLIYAGTYGFPWPVAAMVLLVMLFAATELGRWRTCVVVFVLLLLHRETTAAATFGWAVYIMLFENKRKLGAALAVVSVGYAVLVMTVVIPHFSIGDHYERLGLYGALGNSLPGLMSAPVTRPAIFWGRLIRPEVGYLALLMLTPLFLLPLWRWRLSLAAVPTFVMIALLDNPEWLSVKFWHHCTVLPFLFWAGVSAVRRGAGEKAKDADKGEGGEGPTSSVGERVTNSPFIDRRNCSRARGLGVALGVFFGASLAHYFYGFSPIAKYYHVYDANEFLGQPDPRLAVIEKLRREIPRDRDILASERAAAHFSDYRRLYTGKRDGALDAVDYVIVDRSDRWDSSGLVQQVSALSTDTRFRLYLQSETIVVYARQVNSPKVELD